jgi:Transcriptional Coactivator p15 (PC4)
VKDDQVFIGEIEKSKSIRIRVSAGKTRTGVYIDAREWIEEDDYKGPSKRGLRLNPELAEKVILLLQKGIREAGKLDHSPPTKPRRPNRRLGSQKEQDAAVDRIVLERALGRSIDAIGTELGMSADDVWQLLEEHAEVCRNCGMKLPTEGDGAYACPQCATSGREK